MLSDDLAYPTNVVLSITLTSNGSDYAITGGAVRDLNLDLKPYGFSGSLTFDQLNNSAAGGLFTDSLLTPFQSEDLLTVKLELSAYHPSAQAGETVPSTTFKAIVQRRKLAHVVLSHPQSSGIAHRYFIEFCDPAAFFWRQHFPVQLATDVTPLSILQGACSGLFTVESEAAALTTSMAQIFVGLPADRQISFYDFVWDYLIARNLHLYFDYTLAKYKIVDTKSSTGEATALRPDEVASHCQAFGEIGRATVTCINHAALSPKTSTVSDTRTSSPIVETYLEATSVVKDFDDQVTLRGAAPRHQPSLPTLEMAFRIFPCVDLAPGTLVSFPSSQGWSSTDAIATGDFRIVTTTIALQSDRQVDGGVQNPHGAFNLRLQLTLETKDDKTLRCANFRRPKPEVLVQGLIVSTLGDEGQETWESSEDANKALIYKIKIPAWENKVVSAPFLPLLDAGKLFFPHFREQVVLLALRTHSAKIVGCVSFGQWNTATKDVQGEGMRFGVSDERGAWIAHTDEEAHSKLLIRGLEAKDDTSITISQGVMTLCVSKQQ